MAVVGLAAWTVVYHVCLVARWGVAVAVAAEVVILLLFGAGFVVVRNRRTPTSSEPPLTSPSGTLPRPAAPRRGPIASVALVVTIGLAVAASLTVALQGSWAWMAWLWIGAALVGSGWAALTRTTRCRGRRGLARTHHRAAVGDRRVVLSLVVLRPNPDDEYYVNLSQFVAQNGTFPLRDTMFANLVYPMSSWPPIASYDGLMGTFGYVAGTRAAPFVYIVAPAVLSSSLSLGMWRLLRAWRVKAVTVALSSGMIFLLLDGVAPTVRATCSSRGSTRPSSASSAS